MDTSDLISIIIPVYNPGKYFIRCIESCINQTYTNLEIVLVDDCSTDPYTVQLLNEYAAKDSRIRLLKSPQNSGQAYCRNIGIEACKGKYFALIDNDDSFAVRFIERTHEAIVKYDTDLVLTDICVYPDESISQREAKNMKASRFDLPFKTNAVMDFNFINENGMHFFFPLTVYAKLFNTERYLKSGLQFDPDPELRSVEDEMWASRLEFSLKNFYFMPFVGVFRCMRSSSDGATANLTYCRRSFKSMEKRYLFLREHGIEDKYGIIYLSHVLSRIAAITRAWDDMDARRKQLIEGLNLLQRLTNRNIKRFTDHYIYTSGYNWAGFYNALYCNRRRTTIWWYALPCLHDVTNPKMITIRRWLEGLTDMGVIVQSISTSIRNSDAGVSMLQEVFTQLQENMRKTPQARTPNSLIYNFADNAFANIFIKLIAKEVQDVTEFDNRLLEQCFMKLLPYQKIQADVILVSGTDPCSLKLYGLIKQLGYKLIYVANGGEFEDGFVEGAPQPSKLYSGRSELGGIYTAPAHTKEVISLFDRFITFSPNVAKEWQERFDMPIECLGYLARSTFEENLSDFAQYVTITSDSPDHGFAVFLKIAILMNKTDPDVKFLVNYDIDLPLSSVFEMLHYPDGSTVENDIRALKNLSISSHPNNLDRTYDSSLLMLLPELEQGHSAEPIINALVNGVPVITTTNGEQVQLGSAVTYLDAPKSTLTDHCMMPSDEEVAPYIEAIRKVLKQDHEQNRKDAFKSYDITKAQQAWNDVLLPYGKDPT